ncbi:MAG: DUF2127 domain-containing protein [Bacteroidales bacterium]|nr:DUF2127 domain-containing protein [Bacteroidales bacterium]
MKQLFSNDNIHKYFIISITLKTLNAIAEIVGGVLVFFISQEFVIKTVEFLTHEELFEDPKDVVANYLTSSVEHFSISAKHFIAIYLLSHGLIKLGLIIGLLKNKSWSYPASITIFGLFVIYQVYRYSYSPSIWLFVLTAFDLLVIWIVWREYLNLKKKNITSD